MACDFCRWTHEVGNKFEFSLGKVTAEDVNTANLFYEQPSFWFGVFRYLTEGLAIILIGLFWVNGIAKKRGLRQFNVLPKQSGIAWIMAMSILMSVVVYMMTLTSDVLNDVLSFKADVIIQFPYILSSITLIVLFILCVLKDMEKIWYWLISLMIIITMSIHDILGLNMCLFGLLLLEPYISQEWYCGLGLQYILCVMHLWSIEVILQNRKSSRYSYGDGVRILSDSTYFRT